MIREGDIVGWRVLKDGRIWGATPFDRFLAKIHITSCDCWEMSCGLDKRGYSYFGIGTKRHASHRWLYEQLVGPIPSDMELDHLCRNHRCCNPDHLEPVPHRVNARRGYSLAAMNARKDTCPEGHPYVTRMGKNGKPYRRCLTCHRAQQKKNYLKNDGAATARRWRQKKRSEMAVSA